MSDNRNGGGNPAPESTESIIKRRDEREAAMGPLREAVKASPHSYRDIGSPISSSAGFVGAQLRGNYPYIGGYYLTRKLWTYLEQLGFDVPECVKA